LKIRNWKKHQHYNKPKPPWIKVYRDILGDYDFMRMTVEQKYTVFGLWMIAAETDNKIPDDPAWIKHRLGLNKLPDLQALTDNGFIEPIDTLDTDSRQTLDKVYAQKRRVEKSRVETEESIGDTPEEPKPYRAFGKLSITIEDVEKLKSKYDMTTADVDDVLDRIENFAGNKKYNSLYLTANNWAKKDYQRKQEEQKAASGSIQDMFTVENPEACRKAMIDAEQQIERDRQTQDNSGRDQLRANLAKHLDGELQETVDDNTNTVAATG